MTAAALHAEFRKVMTLKFWWALPIAPILVGLFASAIYATVARDDGIGDTSTLRMGVESLGVYFAIAWAVLFAGLFGAVNAGTDFRHRTFTSTLLVLPRRDDVVVAKYAVGAALGLGYGVAVEATSVVALLAFGSNGFPPAGELTKVLAVGLVAAICWALIGTALGVLFTSSIGAAVALLVCYPLGEFVVASILDGIGLGALARILPGHVTLGAVAAGTIRGVDWIPSWPAAPILLLAWTAVAGVAGWWTTRQRDLTR